MTNRLSPTELVASSGFEVEKHSTESDQFRLVHTFQADHCAPTVPLSDWLTEAELRVRFDSWIKTGKTLTARERTLYQFDGTEDPFSYEKPTRYSVGDKIISYKVLLVTGEEVTIYAVWAASMYWATEAEEAGIDHQSYLLDKSNRWFDFHDSTYFEKVLEIRGWECIQGYRKQRDYYVADVIQIPFGQPIPEFKELDPSDQLCPPELLESLPL